MQLRTVFVKLACETREEFFLATGSVRESAGFILLSMDELSVLDTFFLHDVVSILPSLLEPSGKGIGSKVHGEQALTAFSLFSVQAKL